MGTRLEVAERASTQQKETSSGLSVGSFSRNAIRGRLAQIGLLGLGLIVSTWGVLDPRFRQPDGFPNTAFCLAISVGIALFSLGWLIRGRLWQSASWAALALVGQAVNLQMIEAGPLLHYQHYRSLDQLVNGGNLLLVAFLLIQGALVSLGMRRYFKPLWSWARQAMKPWQVLALASVLIVPTVALSRQVGLYLEELVLAAAIQIVNIGNIFLIVSTIPPAALQDLGSARDKILGAHNGEDASEPGGFDRVAIAAAVWVVLVASLFSYLSYEQHPHVPDEVAYLYQARLIAAGLPAIPAPPVPAAFDFYLAEFKAGQEYFPTPPGWPAMLALGVKLGVPGLVNPLLAGINVLLSYLLLRELFDRWTARLAVILLAISPWFLFMSMNLMTHTFNMTCALAGALLVAWSRRTNKVRWALLGGVMVGAGSLIRPLDGLIAAVLIGLWLIGVGGARLKVSSIAAFAVGTILVAAVVLPYNWSFTGKATVFPLNAYLDEHFGAGRNDLGFGANRGYDWALQPYPGHSPLGALVNTELNTFSMDVELFGWSTGSLLFIGLLLILGKTRRSDRLMLAVIVLTVGVFFFYWYSGGPDFGARYWYLILLPCVVLTVRGMQHASTLLSSVVGPKSANSYVLAAVFVLSLLSVVNYLPWRAIDKYHDYELMRPDIPLLAKQFNFGNSLVLIRGISHPDYASAAIYNPLDPGSNEPVYAWDPSPEIATQVIRAFPDRRIWIVNGPTLTHRGFEIAAGPLSAAEFSTATHPMP